MKNDTHSLIESGRYRLLQAVNLALIVLVVTLGSIRYILTNFEALPVPAIMVAVGCALNAMYVHRNGRLSFGAWLVIVLLLFGLAFGGFITYGFGGPVVLMAPLIPLLALLLIGLRSGLLAFLGTGAVLWGIFYLQVQGVIPSNPYDANKVALARFLVLLAICAISTWMVWRFASITTMLVQKIERLSKTDYLTETLNRRGIELMLSREVARAHRTNSWLSVLLIDVDHFKYYNDINGHQAGDKCLVGIVDVIRSCINRKTDTVGRFGGEEFVVILPDTDSSGAAIVAERIREKMHDRRICYDPDKPQQVTLTLGGVSRRGSSVKDSDHLIYLADRALYQGKREGRDRLVFGPEGEGDEATMAQSH
ncbi:MAG: hypothetical protein CMK32_11485 [Porticoccaceae bacterium]|nr:hypothetical protein [Porticoccaceae bacterium]